MNDLLYYEPLADLCEADATYQEASTQVRFGYLTLAASFHWNLRKLLGHVSPTYHLAPPVASHDPTLVQLPYLNEALKLHVTLAGISADDWLEHASAALLAEIHADCLASLLCTGSADVATTLLSNVGGTLVIRVVLNALRLAHRRTVEPAVLEEAISTLCLLSHRRYEGRIPELAVCFGPSRRRPDRKAPAVYFGREFLASKKSAVLLKGSTLVLHCLSNGRVAEAVDLDFASPGPVSDRVLGPLSKFSPLNYSYHHAAVTTMLTRQGEVLVAMGARLCFSWDAASWRVYPAMRLSHQLRDERLGALLVVSSSEDMIGRLIRNRQEAASPVEALYSRLFVGRPLCQLSPQLVCNAASLDGAIVIDGHGIVRGIGCIFEPQGVHTPAEGARTPPCSRPRVVPP
jgi:hypothetical protein